MWVRSSSKILKALGKGACDLLAPPPSPTLHTQNVLVLVYMWSRGLLREKHLRKETLTLHRTHRASQKVPWVGLSQKQQPPTPTPLGES